jgi:alpha-glucosidase
MFARRALLYLKHESHMLRNDIDYMHGYRDFENDENRFPYIEGEEFLDRLHESGRHYVPIIDSAIYIPNPKNASDA